MRTIGTRSLSAARKGIERTADDAAGAAQSAQRKSRRLLRSRAKAVQTALPDAPDVRGAAAETRKRARKGWKRSRKQLEKTAAELDKSVRSELSRSAGSLDEPLESALSAGRRLASLATGGGSATLLGALAPAAVYGLLQARARHRLPIQCAVDIAAPLEFVYDEWMRLELLPEGVHRVEEIERDDDGVLVGEAAGTIRSHDWEAEILDEREGESFAWRSRTGSDCAGLITFHELAERLTRLELQLDLVPTSPSQAIELALHTADRRAEAELRRFKAHLETVSPDAYGGGQEQDTDDKEG